MPRTVVAHEPTPLSKSTSVKKQNPRIRPDDGEHQFHGSGSMERALSLVRYLRAECPWDSSQTPESLIPHLLEETHEVIDAIRGGDVNELEEELGDLLLNLAFQIVIAEEAGQLDADSVYGRLETKMIGRHPQLFGNGEYQEWEALKAAEGLSTGGVLHGLAKGLDPLTNAYRIQERVAGIGFDWPNPQGAHDKVTEELEEVTEAIESGSIQDIVEELGDLLFAVVNLVRLTGAHPTTALARANTKFHKRFEKLEALAKQRDIDLTAAGLETLDILWEKVKQEPDNLP